MKFVAVHCEPNNGLLCFRLATLAQEHNNHNQFPGTSLMTPVPLPIDDVLPSFLSALRDHASVVLRAPTGAGKTTRVPPAIVDAGIHGERQIVMLEPRRLAARAAARRMSVERGRPLGDEIGYHVRHDRVAGPRTRVLVVTEGILLRMLMTDPYLESISVIVLDEFHERSLDADLVLGMVRILQQTVRPDLKLVAMSATLDVQRLQGYLEGCPVITSEGRLFPVEIRYQPRTTQEPLSTATARAVHTALGQSSGDVLAFLPGMAEIRGTVRVLETDRQSTDFDLAILHGDISPEQQDAALLRGPRRKVILATNVAETSVTVEGISAVVDTGLSRQLVYDPRVGLDRLVLGPISKSSAEQRAGRAGRLGPGLCIRLWDANHHRVRSAQTEPEVRRVDLVGAVLQLIALGENDLEQFPWFEAPRAESLQQARLLLTRLGALAHDRLTELGRQMAQLPLSPRLARLVIEGAQLGFPEEAALVAALLSERDLFRKADRDRGPRADTGSDVIDRMEALQEFEHAQRTEFAVGTLARGAARSVLHTRSQLLRVLRPLRAAVELAQPSQGQAGQVDEAIGRALLVAFPDRVTRRRVPNSPRGVMVGGRGVRLDTASGVHAADLFLAIDLDGRDVDALVRQASRIERHWLPESQITRDIELEFDEAAERVTARRRVRFLDLVLEEDQVPLPKDDRVAKVLAASAQRHFDRVQPTADSEAGRFLGRLQFLRKWMPELELPEFSETEMQERLEWLCHGCRSFEDLRRANWLGAIEQSLTHLQRAAIQREAPERVAVPSGSNMVITYESGRPPTMAVRIQEIFGWRDTPRIAGGRVKMVLHLLGPNYRPQQITDDLASFWANGYPEVRKELRRRYPRHAWPEDPTTATAERKPRRR